MSKKTVLIELKSEKDGIRKYPINATVLHGWAVHRACSGWGYLGTPMMDGRWWTISAPNGRALGEFVTQKMALDCIREIYEFATVNQVAAIPTDKENRTPEQHALASRVMNIVNSYRPNEEGEL